MQLQLEGLTKEYPGGEDEDFRLHPLDLTIQPGEFFSLLGPSGCGKTTVLRLIGGFESATSGRIILNGEDITALPPHRRNIHTVFQRYALFPHLNVFENVAFSLRLKKVSGADLEARVTETLRLVEISALRDRKTSQLSGGQAQRVALARALVDHPAVLLLDEPLSALDPALRVKMRDELKGICRKVGATFIFVTHDQEEALLLSDRLAVMKDGRCLQVGTPKTIYEDPTEAFVARFIGPTNEIPGEVYEDSEDNLHLQSVLGSFKIRRNGTPLPRNVSLILRPEKMRLMRQRSSTQENQIEGEIQELSYLGSRTEYTVRTRHLIFRVFEPELERAKKRGLSPGDKIFLSWRTEDAIVLPGERGA